MSILSKLIGSTIDGKYQIDRKLGQGGMGAVYHATHLGTGRPVALKVISPDFMSNNEFIERFKREAKAAGLLRHPNVVNVTDFGFADLYNHQLAYLVMEFLDGQSLATLLEKRPQLPLKLVVDIVEQICSAIDEAHNQGIIHRDLKPDNIWLEPDRRGGFNIKVLDFGLAKLRTSTTTTDLVTTQSSSETPTRKIVTGESESAITAIQPLPIDNKKGAQPSINSLTPDDNEANTIALPSTVSTKAIELNLELTTVGAILGTPIYMSPEQCLGKKLDERSDIYSLGVIVYRMLAGQPPFTGDIATLIKKHTETAPPSLQEQRRDLPGAVNEVIMSALAKTPDKRPNRAIAFATALRAGSEGVQPLLNRSLAIYGEHLSLFLRLSFITHLPFIMINLLIFYFVTNIPTTKLTVNQLLVFKQLVWLSWLLSGCFANVLNNSACAVLVKQLLSQPDREVQIQSILNQIFTRLPILIHTTIYHFIIGMIRPLRVIFNRLPGYSNVILTPAVIMLEALPASAVTARAQLLAERLRASARRLATRDLFIMLLPVIAFPIQFLICGLLFDLFQPEGISRETILLLLLIIPVLQVVLLHPSTSIATTLLYFKTKQITGEQINTELNETEIFADIQRRKPIALAFYLIISLLIFLLTVVTLQTQMMGFLIRQDYANTTAVLIGIGMRADLVAKDERGNDVSALEMAIERGNFKTAEMLLEKSLFDEENMSSELKTTILYKAAYSGNIAIIKMLMEKLDKRVSQSDIDEMCYIAVLSGNQTIINYFIDKGADISTPKPGHTFTPLMTSAFHGRVNIVKLLLTRGVEVNTQMNSGHTAITSVAGNGIYIEGNGVMIDNSYDICKILIEHGADLNYRDEKGDTAILIAAIRDFPNKNQFVDNTEDLLKLLLVNGADINDTNTLTGSTPLHNAAKSGNPGVIKILLENGADVNRRDKKGCTPIVNLLSARNLDESALKNRFKLAAEFIKHGADVTLTDQEGNSAYKLALNLGRPEWIELMEKAGEK